MLSSHVLNAPMKDVSQRNLKLALTASLVLHAVLLSIHFKLPQALERASQQAMDVILVNKKSAQKPTHAQAKAQTNADGGGNTDQDRRAATPLPPSPQQQQGNDLVDMKRRTAELEAMQQQLMSAAQSKRKTLETKRRVEVPNETPVPLSGLDYADTAKAFAQQMGAIERQMDEYNKRPRKKFIGIRTEEVKYAQYMEAWREKVQRIGSLNYPEAARGKLYGQPTLAVSIGKEGELIGVEVVRSSGHKVLDDAAVRIVRLAAPFAKFPPDIAKDTDILDITRQWHFTVEGSLGIGNK